VWPCFYLLSIPCHVVFCRPRRSCRGPKFLSDDAFANLPPAAGLKPGIYTVQLRSERCAATAKLVVQWGCFSRRAAVGWLRRNGCTDRSGGMALLPGWVFGLLNCHTMKKRLLLCLSCSLLLFSCGKKDEDKNNANPQPAGLRTFTLNATASSSHNTAAENTASKSFLSMSNEAAYTYAEASSKQADLDFTVRTSYYNGAPPASTANIFVGSILNDVYRGDENVQAFGIRNATTTAFLNSQSPQVDFDAIRTPAQLDSLFGKLSAASFTATGDFTVSGKSLVAFKDHRGKRGLITVTNYNANKPFNFTMQVKMEP
jgi:hypothetical protein